MRPIIYLSTFFPRQHPEFQQSLKSAANISASAFSYSILNGLIANVKERLFIINTPPTGPYPINYGKILSRSCITEEDGLVVKTIGTFNLYGIQGFSIANQLEKEMKDLEIGDADILIYSIQLPLLKTAVKYKKKYCGSRIILVVPDLYEDLVGDSILKKVLKNILYGDYSELSRYVDAYVLLTPLMIEKMPEKKPFRVLEGIYNPSEKRQKRGVEDGFTILYTGMLYEKFGVKNLVDAVHALKMKDVKLKLCGSGELVEYIKKINDARIEYLGILPRENVLQLQSDVSLLVNPRQPNGGFTRYSFPSKNIEYLASGTPSLIYELEGIPQEYYLYCYHLSADENSVEDLVEMIKKIYHTPESERKKLGKEAQNFIYTQKNAPAQCEIIIKLIDSL